MALKSLLLIVGVAVLAFNTGANASPDYVANATEIVKAADWEQMETVTVIMAERGEEFFYQPSNITFKVGQAYRLELKNKGKKKHYFTAPEFFKAIASRKVQSDKDGEIKAPYFLALEMMPKGGQLNLYFVPVKRGTYQVHCTIDDHRERGMHGSIVIQ